MGNLRWGHKLEGCSCSIHQRKTKKCVAHLSFIDVPFLVVSGHRPTLLQGFLGRLSRSFRNVLDQVKVRGKYRQDKLFHAKRLFLVIIDLPLCISAQWWGGSQTLSAKLEALISWYAETFHFFLGIKGLNPSSNKTSPYYNSSSVRGVSSTPDAEPSTIKWRIPLKYRFPSPVLREHGPACFNLLKHTGFSSVSGSADVW